jgi:hypothetical protein
LQVTVGREFPLQTVEQPSRRTPDVMPFCSRVDRATTGVSDYPDDVSPTVLRVRGFRFYFFSREEPRMHVHVYHANGEAKFWLEPTVELAASYGLSASRVNEASKLIEEHLDEIRSAWAKHFGG